MCGIAGFVGDGDRHDLVRMTDRMIHRGPDDCGYYTEDPGGVFLGHRRLSILDLKTGKQPLWNEDETIGIVFNGEIYNHKTLRRELEDLGHHFITDHSDTEALVHGYEEWGDRVVQRLNGMWAFALYDRPRGRLFLSRDRFGKKPLYYYHSRSLFGFASELRALICHSGVPAETDTLSLKKYFAYGFIPAPRSLYKRILKLPAGHNLSYDIRAGDVSVSRYWEFILDPFTSWPKDPVGSWGEELRHRFDRAVECRLEADVPLGVFLSGGIDSSAVAAAASDSIGPGGVKTFSIGFHEASFDESEYAQYAATSLGTDHHHKKLSLERAENLVPEVISRLDEPIADGSLIPTFLLSRFTREHVTVALSGDGGDELFAGYDPFRALRYAEFFDKLVPNAARKKLRSLADLLPVTSSNMSLDFRIKRTLQGLCYNRPLWNPVWLSPLEPMEIETLFHEPVDVETLYSEALQYWRECPMGDLVDKTLHFYTKMYLQDDILPKVDRTSMMVSLEVRCPFLDIDFVDFVRRIPWGWKLRNGRTKYLFKESFRKRIPERILDRPKKGFGIPLTKWLRDDWGRWRPRKWLGVDSGAFLEAKAEEHCRARADHRLFLWAGIVLGAFL